MRITLIGISFLFSFVFLGQDTIQSKKYRDTSMVEVQYQPLAPSFYKQRYQEKDLMYKTVDNFGEGYEPLYGTRNFRSIIHGVAYRGGANNFYHKKSKRKNQNPLPNDGLINLCKEGFSTSVYLYRNNADESYDHISCNCIDGTENELNYLQLDYFDSEHIYLMMKMVYESATDSSKGPVYFHCWNGWHASGFIAALTLKQFCGYSSDQAVEYWDLGTDGANRSAHYNSIRKQIREFIAYPEFILKDSLGVKICPPMPGVVDASVSPVVMEQLVMVPEAVPVGSYITIDGLVFPPNAYETNEIRTNEDIKKLVRALSVDNNIRIEIGGHTDKSGNEDVNKRLSSQRAKFVRDYLIKEENIDSNRLLSMGYGSTKPAYSNKTKEGRDANRRIEIKLLSKKEYKTEQSKAILVNESVYNEKYKKWEDIEQVADSVPYVLTNLIFPPNTIFIKDTKNKDLYKLEEFLRNNSDINVLVSGYTDASGLKENNDTLSQKRADFVRVFLVSKGIDESRIVAKGFGSQNPIADNRLKWGRDLNRRIEVMFLKTE